MTEKSMTHPAPITSEPKLAPGELRLRTGAWYGDRLVTVHVPPLWDIEVFTPNVGASLTDAQIAQRLESPVGQPPIRELCRGKARPVVIVDDLNRPTPASRVVPALLRQFEDAGIAARNVGIIMAPGTHGAPRADALAKKVGAEAAGSCQLHIHDCNRDVVKLGSTSFGTPVLVNKHVVESDFLVGVGGLYPNYTAGFGGGSKLALGVLGFRSIATLHYAHPGMGWGTPNSHSTFRRDLDEIARMIGLGTTVSVLLNADRDVIDMVCGDPHTYYADALRSARAAFRAPLLDERADVIISNAYPNDLSLTFVRMKGIAPLNRAPLGASRIAIASCAEGLGFHGLFPFMNAPRFHRQRMRAEHARMLLTNPGLLAHKVRGRLTRGFGSRRDPAAPYPIWLYCPDPTNAAGLPAEIPGMRVTSSWDEIVEAVRREQGDRAALRALVYGCAALQWLA
jgi:nickel-dependent lactate racemase